MSVESAGPGAVARYEWSSRLLILALAGIFFLTFYPFEFVTHAKDTGHVSPFLLGRGAKDGSTRDIFLNILLFVPFGFALGKKLRNAGKSWAAVLIVTTLAGAFLSYAIEFVQFYIPQRDSGWEDVFTNSTGAAVGVIALMLIGKPVFWVLSRAEEGVRNRATLWLAAIMLAIYFAAWFGVSAVLQKQTHLDNWMINCRLVLGNDAQGEHPWKGRVSLFEIWDHAMPQKQARELSHGVEAQWGTPVEKFECSTDLVNVPATRLIDALKNTNQFSIHLVLSPPQGENTSGDIASISNVSGSPDLFMIEEEGNFVFWFRNVVSLRRPALDWSVPHLLTSPQRRNYVFSYDGSELWIYIEGKAPKHYAMGPGTALASYVRHLKETELNGYRVIYYALVFFPPGAWLGMLVGKRLKRLKDRGATAALMFVSVVTAPVILEWILVRENGRSFSFTNWILSAAMLIFGVVWMNSDLQHFEGSLPEAI